MVSFAREPLTDTLWSEALPLLFAHWQELAKYEDIELAPDRNRYDAMESAGVLRVFTARDELGLIGYAVFIISPLLHYRKALHAQQDVFFIERRARGTTGVRFIRFCENQLTLDGVQLVVHHAKTDPKHSMASILERMGYETIDVVMAKRLDRPDFRFTTGDAALDEDPAVKLWLDESARRVHERLSR
jgi:hypothetical protein